MKKELLLQLHEQAEEYAQSFMPTGTYFDQALFQEYNQRKQEKFAELIVNECAKYVDDNLSETGFGQADGWVNGDQIREHFKVEQKCL